MMRRMISKPKNYALNERFLLQAALLQWTQRVEFVAEVVAINVDQRLIGTNHFDSIDLVYLLIKLLSNYFSIIFKFIIKNK